MQCVTFVNRERECSVLHLSTGSVNAACYICQQGA